jgi:CRISPR-associated endonuclease/helicase Cas3
MLSYFDLISHPDRSLERHLDQCNQISQKALDLKYLSEAFYSQEDIDYWRKLLVYFHDFGKSSDYFQHRIIKATEEARIPGFFEANEPYIDYFKKYRDSGVAEALEQERELGGHSKQGAYYLFTQFSHADPIVQVILMKVILRHHGNLTNFEKDRENRPVILLDDNILELLERQLERVHFELYSKILIKSGLAPVSPEQWSYAKEKFVSNRQVNKWREYLKAQNTLKYFFLQHFLFSLLLSADKGDMQLPKTDNRLDLIRRNFLIDGDGVLIENYKLIEFKGTATKLIDIKREEAFQDIADNAQKHGFASFFSITLPTGMGKTFAAYKSALVLQKQYMEQYGQVPRIIYCLPFTSVIDQNAAILQDIFTKNGKEISAISIHHYLSSFNERYDDIDNNEINFEFSTSEYMTEGWEHDVIVTTFVQLLDSIFTNRNRALRKFHNMTNAIIVLDEVQSIPPKYFNVVEEAFRHFSKYFGTKFVFVTATQPYLFKDKSDIIELTDPTWAKTKSYFGGMSRISLDQSMLIASGYNEMDIDLIKEALLNDVQENPDKSVLVICNTIKQSQAMYRFLANWVREMEPQTPIRYLSSSIIPYSRKKIIAEIKDYKGRQFLVSTQVVEAGVDIDFDLVYRDFTTLDSINQSAGRCNRNGVKESGGVVKLFHAGKAKHIYKSELLNATKRVLQQYGPVIKESSFLELNDKYAREVRDVVAEQHDESVYLLNNMKMLNLDDVDKTFKLIDDNQLSYNVFIPINGAQAIWNEYLLICKIEERFERKARLKQFRGRFLPFVTRFPKNSYKPPAAQKENFIINDPNWRDNYDLVLGFIGDIDEQTTTI